MRYISLNGLRGLWNPDRNSLINRLLEFNDSPSGVAAFLDDLREREECIPMLESVPNLAEYGRPLTRYLLFLHEIASSYILVPHIHDEQQAVRVEIEVGSDARFDAILRLRLSHTTEAIQTRSIVHEPAMLTPQQDGPPIPIDHFRYDDRYYPAKTYKIEIAVLTCDDIESMLPLTMHHIESLIRRGMNERGRPVMPACKYS